MRRFYLIGLFPLLAGCSEACTNKLVNSIVAPDGQHSAVLFQRDCGATTGFSTQVSILDVGKQPLGGGNAYSADDDHGVAFVGPWQGPWAEMKWVAADHLLIRYAAKSRIFDQTERVDGVHITYIAVSR